MKIKTISKFISYNLFTIVEFAVKLKTKIIVSFILEDYLKRWNLNKMQNNYNSQCEWYSSINGYREAYSDYNQMDCPPQVAGYTKPRYNDRYNQGKIKSNFNKIRSFCIPAFKK